MSAGHLTNRWRNMPATSKSGTVLAISAAAIAIYLLAAPKPWAIAQPEGPNIPFEYFATVYCWWGGLIALAGVASLYLARSWWSQPFDIPAPQVQPAPRWFWPLVASAMLLTAIMGAMRLGHDLWDDERKTLQQFVQGDYRPNEDGSVRFREYGWGRPIFNYREVNNHILHSIFARTSIAIWKIFRTPESSPFSEIALRFPAFLCGIFSIAAIALMLKELGLARAGVIGAFLLAIHPWHIRYASEARGYALVLLLMPLLLATWIRAMRTPRWRWWNAVAACEFGLLYTYPVTFYPVAALNILTVLLIAAGLPGTAPRGIILRRWLTTSFVAGLVFAWLFLPCVPQLKIYLAGERAAGEMGGWWLRDFFSHLFAGAPWFRAQNPGTIHPELSGMFAVWPRLGPAIAWCAIALGAAGTIRIAARGWLGAASAAVLLLPAAFVYLEASHKGHFLYEWYLIYALPGAVAAVATGLDTLMRPWRGREWTNWATAGVVITFAGAYWAVTTKARDWLLTKPLQPMRASVLLTRPTTLPNYAGYTDVITASFNTPPGLYDPHCKRIGSREELEQLMQESDRRGVPLFMNIGNPWAASYHHPDLYRITTQSPYFEEVATLPGFDPTLDRQVTRYVPGSWQKAGSAD